MTDILISAGHYPERAGATFQDFVEHEEAVLWMDAVVGILEQDVSVRKVPTGTLSSKIAYINEVFPRLAVEIHFNDAVKKADDGSTLHVGRGCETRYCPGSKLGRVAAQVVHNSISDLFLPDRGIKEGYYRMNPANGPDAFLGKTKCTALIVEPDFVARRKLVQRNREEACVRLANGIKLALQVLSNY